MTPNFAIAVFFFLVALVLLLSACAAPVAIDDNRMQLERMGAVRAK